MNTKPQGKGGLYAKLRELTLSDAVLGLALIAIVGVTWNTDRNVASLVKSQERADLIEAKDATVRASTFTMERERTREKLGDFEGRLRRLEQAREGGAR